MISSAKEFIKLRTSANKEEYRRSANDSAPIEVWWEIIRNHSDMVIWVIRNKTVPLEILQELSSSPDSNVRYEIANKRKLDRQLFEKLSKDPNEVVRARISYNKKVPQDILEALANDPEPLVNEAAKLQLNGRKP